MVFEGAVYKRILSVYMEEMSLSQLKDTDIVIMDNLSVHKNSFDVNKLTSLNIEIKYLPAYSQT